MLDFLKLGLNFDSLLLPIAVPFVIAIIVFVIPKAFNKLRWFIALLASLLNIYIASVFFFMPIGRTAHIGNILSVGTLNIDFNLFMDNWNRILLLAVAIFGVLVILYSLRYMQGKKRIREYYTYLVFTLAFTNGALLANNLLLLVIFWEILTALLFFLITIGGKPSRHPAGKSFVMLGFSDAAFLIGVLLVWRITGSLTITDVNVHIGSAISYVAYILILIAALAKAGAIPLHTWIPRASEGAPISVMAFLPASLDKILGIYLLARITLGKDILGMSEIFTIPTGSFLLPLLLIIGAITIFFAVMAALVQHDLRKLLSFHAVSQVGYMVMGIGTGIPIGVIGGLFHMVNHAIYKSCLFLSAGSVERQTGKMDLSKIGGLARYMPATFLGMTIAALAISGVPPLNGFASKLMIYEGTIERASAPIAGNASFSVAAFPVIAIIALIVALFGSALTLASFIKVLYSLFLGRKPEELGEVKEAPVTMRISTLTLAGLCLILGIFAIIIFPMLGTQTALWNTTAATLLIILALIIGVIIFLFGKISQKTKVSEAFYGGEKLDSELIRYPGTDFYEAIQNMGRLKTIYEDADEGVFDPYVLTGKYGERLVNVGKKMHNGILSTYLAFCIIGIAVVLFFLFKTFLGL